MHIAIANLYSFRGSVSGNDQDTIITLTDIIHADNVTKLCKLAACFLLATPCYSHKLV